MKVADTNHESHRLKRIAVCCDVGSLGESTLMQAAMENDARSDDPDATVDLRPPAGAPTPSNNRTLTAGKQLKELNLCSNNVNQKLFIQL